MSHFQLLPVSDRFAFLDPGKFWVSNFDAVIDFSYMYVTTLWVSYIIFQPIPQMHGPVQVTFYDNFPGKHFI